MYVLLHDVLCLAFVRACARVRVSVQNRLLAVVMVSWDSAGFRVLGLPFQDVRRKGSRRLSDSESDLLGRKPN